MIQLAKIDVMNWLEERRDNCRRIAAERSGNDRNGWLDDYEHFSAAIALIEARNREEQSSER